MLQNAYNWSSVILGLFTNEKKERMSPLFNTEINPLAAAPSFGILIIIVIDKRFEFQQK